MSGGSGKNQEIEIKLAAETAGEARRRLREAGFHVVTRRTFEANLVLDTPEGLLRAAGTLLRLRTFGNQALLTFKGPVQAGRHKSREELEVAMPALEPMLTILGRLGYTTVFRYDKYRTELRREGSRGLALLDETPIGVYLELEGPPQWIDRTAKRLGYAPDDYITESYGALYFAWCEREGVAPSHMVFEKSSKAQRGDR